MEKGYEFDDVLIRPIPSTVGSRDDVDISVKLSNTFKLDFPLIASPMVGVVDASFAQKLSELGGLAILHRFYKNRQALFNDIEEFLWYKNSALGRSKFGISIGIDEKFYEEYFEYNPSILLVDTANGYTSRLLKYCDEVKSYIIKNGYDTLLMSGNVATKEGVENLRDYGCDIVRMGIGGGSPCSTRNKTGIGVPNLSALLESVDITGIKILIDGGIKNSGDFVKSIVAGADLGMAGKLFAECYESPNEGVLYGMASRTHMENSKIDIKSVEGFDTIIDKKQSLKQFVREFSYGIKSAGTYLNARSLSEIRLNATFMEVTDNAIKKNIKEL